MTIRQHPRRPSSDADSRLQPAELALVGAVGLILAVASTWPLALHLGSRVPGSARDPLLEAWIVGWGGHALVHQPLHLFQANIFWPLRDTYAFTDALLGYSPFAVIGSGLEATTARYNLIFLAAAALTFTTTYLLARELGAGRFGGGVAGAAFAYAPWRLAHATHLHVLSAGGIPLALFLLLRGYRRSSAPQILAGWIAAAWQVSLGFTLGLQFLYLLLIIGSAAAVVWLRRGRPAQQRHVILSTVLGVCVLAAVSIALSRPYLRVLHDYPEAARNLTTIARYSPPLRSLVAADPSSLLWGGATSSARQGLSELNEQVLFPGLAIVLLALAGLGSGAFSVRTRRWLAAAALVSLVFAFGLTLGGDLSPYRLLYEIAPGWEGIRTPSRLFTLTSLALALLAAAGAQRAWAWATGWGGVRRRLLLVVVPAAVFLEGFGPISVNRVPLPPVALRTAAAPLLILPSNSPRDEMAEYWSTDGFPAMVNGYSGFVPRRLNRLRKMVHGFPDRRSVALLRGMGVRSVLLDRPFAAGTPWRKAAAKSVTGLGVGRRDIGSVTTFELDHRRP